MSLTITQIAEQIQNKDLFEQAITLAQGTHAAAYERLEFLGDRVLGLIIADMLYHRFPDEKEGKWALRFTALVKEETLANVARELNIPAVIKTSEEKLRENNSILSDVCEAVLGALYLDRGLPVVENVVKELWEPLINNIKTADKDPKSMLQEWSLRHLKSLPEYKVLSKSGPDHAPVFEVQVAIKRRGSMTGSGRSKKEAMQHAAELMLKKCSKKTKKKEAEETSNNP